MAGVTVLIVDDHVDSREALGKILADLGARVMLASNGADALTVLARAMPDVVLCDLCMPVMDGFALIERVRRDRRLARLPVIAVTALDTPAALSATRRAGFAGHFVKPLDVETLVARLEAYSPAWRGRAA